jgi:hypothetical protein
MQSIEGLGKILPFAHDPPLPSGTPTLTGAYNTAYTLRASPLPFGTFCYRKTSYMLIQLSEIFEGTDT